MDSSNLILAFLHLESRSVFMSFLTSLSSGETLVNLHLFHGLLEEDGGASLRRCLLQIGQVRCHVDIQIVDVVGMVLLELLDSRSNESEKRLQDDSVHNFGAHKWTERELEPDQEKEFQCVVEGDP